MEKLENLVIKMGGSVLFDSAGEFKVNLVERLADVIRQLLQDYLVVLVVGGGSTSRSVVHQMKDQITNNTYLDHLSILATRFHAETIRGMFIEMGFQCSFVNSYEQLFQVDDEHKLYIMGGLFPGQSTNGTAAVAAEGIGAERIFTLFNYDYIRSKDPEREEGGEILREISYDKMEELIAEFKQKPGHYELFDRNALNFVSRSGIEVVFLNGNEPERILEWEEGRGMGTVLKRHL